MIRLGRESLCGVAACCSVARSVGELLDNDACGVAKSSVGT